MNYAKKRDIVNKRKRKIIAIVLVAVIVLLIGLTILSVFRPIESWAYYVSLPKTGKRADGELRIHYVDVGQGDATVIELPDGKTALIDGGDDTDKTKMTLLRYLNALGIDKLDYLIVTHTDADHCGGLDAVVKHKSIGRAYVPEKRENVGAQYSEFYGGLEKENCEILPLMRGRIDEGDAPYTFSLLYPYAPALDETDTELTDDNARSGVIYLEYGGVSTVFMGDAPAAVETALVAEAKRDLLQPFAPRLHDTALLKISHHGSNSATTSAFLRYLRVKTAVVSCGANNLYNHPNAKTLERLNEQEITTYRTDLQGHIIATLYKDNPSYVIRTV